MKKTLFLLLLLPIFSWAQQIDSTISSEKFGDVTAKFYKTTKGGDTRHYVSFAFQNKKYEYITDIGVVIIPNQVILDSLISDLEGATKYFETKTTVRYVRTMYSIVHYEFSPDALYLEDRRGKYTILDSYQTRQLLAWLKTIKFP